MRKKIDDGGFETPYRLKKQVVESVFGEIEIGVASVSSCCREKNVSRVVHDLHRPQSLEAVHLRNRCVSQLLATNPSRDACLDRLPEARPQRDPRP